MTNCLIIFVDLDTVSVWNISLQLHQWMCHELGTAPNTTRYATSSLCMICINVPIYASVCTHSFVLAASTSLPVARWFRFSQYSILQCYQIKVQSCDNTNGISTDLTQYQTDDALIDCFWLMLFNRQYICFAAEKIRIRKSTTQLPRATYISLYVFSFGTVFARKVKSFICICRYRENRESFYACNIVVDMKLQTLINSA